LVGGADVTSGGKKVSEVQGKFAGMKRHLGEGDCTIGEGEAARMRGGGGGGGSGGAGLLTSVRVSCVQRSQRGLSVGKEGRGGGGYRASGGEGDTKKSSSQMTSLRPGCLEKGLG